MGLPKEKRKKKEKEKEKEKIYSIPSVVRDIEMQIFLFLLMNLM